MQKLNYSLNIELIKNKLKDADLKEVAKETEIKEQVLKDILTGLIEPNDIFMKDIFKMQVYFNIEPKDLFLEDATEDLLDFVFIELEKIESFNKLVYDKLEEVKSGNEKEPLITLYNINRNIDAYITLNTSISESIFTIEEKLKQVYRQKKQMQNEAKKTSIADNIQ